MGSKEFQRDSKNAKSRIAYPVRHVQKGSFLSILADSGIDDSNQNNRL